MSEEAKAGLVKAADNRMITFIEKGIETLDGAMQVAQFLIDSKIIPYHFYEKLPDGKPDFSKGKLGAVAGVLVHGIGTLKLPAMTALQNIIPVNGLLSIKGDLAKSMIFTSGMLRKDSWKEVITGSIENEDMEVSITATREDNGLTLTKSFSVNDAKRAGLWITQAQVNGQDGWKYKSSPWWKYQKRMLYYRPLGYLARDLFGDVLNNMYTTEEAMDMPADQTLVIDQGGGVTLQIPDKGFAEERSKQISSRAVTKIENKNFAPVDEKPITKRTPSAFEGGVTKEESPFIPDKGSVEFFDGKVVDRGDDPDTSVIPTRTDKTLKEMEEMPTEKLLELVNTHMDMIDAMMTIPGKNTNKKLREIVWAFQQGKLAEHVAPYINTEPGDAPTEAPAGTGTEPPAHFDEANASDIGVTDIEPNKDFDKEPELIKPKTSELNSAGIDIPAFNKGEERDFVAIKELYYNLGKTKPPINNERFLELQAGDPKFTKFKHKEDFCKYATIDEVLALLKENDLTL